MKLFLIPLVMVIAYSTGSCVPGQSCFPTEEELSSFNTSINGRLHAERPMASVCYIGDSDFNEEGCIEYSLNATSGRYRYSHFPSYQYVNWEYCGPANCSARDVVNDTTCKQGSVPRYAVYAETVEDISHYVKFATRHNLRIVVKNTGHDLVGRSAGKGGFAVWTHNLKNITIHDSFHPIGCNTMYEKAISLDAGVQWLEAYTAAAQHGRVVVGGLAESVGAAGGWVQGGGHSFLTPSYGLGADNLIEAEIVTPDGNIHRVSECTNSNLFWALRGGGGGTWGVVSQVTYRTRRDVPLYTASVSFTMAIQNITFKDMLTQWIMLAPVLGNLGVGGATVLSPGSLGATLVLPSSEATWIQFEQAIRPFSDWMAQLNNNVGSVTFTNFTGWFDYYMKTQYTSDIVAGSAGSASSRIIPRHYYENNATSMAEVMYQGLMDKVESGDFYPVIIGLAAPVKLRHLPRVTSVNPVWYESLWHIVSDPNFIQLLRTFAPDGAVYFGESDPNEPNWEEGYWGTNYNCLKDIKDSWDPNHHFQVWHGVGAVYQHNDQWECYYLSE